MQRSKNDRYFITVPARRSSVSGIVKPSALVGLEIYDEFKLFGLLDLVGRLGPQKSYPRSSRRANYALNSAGRANAGFIDEA